MPSSEPKPVGSLIERIRAIAQAAEENPALRGRLDALAEEAISAEEAEKRRRLERTWFLAGLPERLWPMLHASEVGAPGGPEPTAALAAVEAFLAPGHHHQVLVLSGGVGTGKTVAASWGCALHGRVTDARPVARPTGRLVKALDLVRAGLFPDDVGFWPGMQRTQLLAIDDLGAEPLDSKGYGHVAVSDLLDRRYDGGRQTIITTNLGQADFKNRYGSQAGIRLWDRIREVGTWLDLVGGSMRKAGGAP